MAKIYATANPDVSEREIKNMERSRAIASQGMVLLANNGVLPIKNTGKIALYGKDARMTVKGGTGSGDVNSRNIVNIEQGLEMTGFEITSKAWLDIYDTDTAAAKSVYYKKLQEAKEESMGAFIKTLLGAYEEPAEPLITPEYIASDCSRAIYVITRTSGEGVDRKPVPGDYLLSANEEENIRRLTRAYSKVIVVLNVGGVIDTRFLRTQPGIGAVLLMSQAGCMGGCALADVLTAKVNPSGCLTGTWAEEYRDYPGAMTFSHMNGNLDDEFYSEGIYVGYRYFDSFGISPAYPFGFGLSYTDFDVQTAGVNYLNGKITVDVTVTNAGKLYAGQKAVQIYCSAPQGEVEKPYQELVAFAKTRKLEPGERQHLSISIPIEQLACYNEKNASYMLEAGDYYIRVGVHSRNTHVAALLRLSTSAVTWALSNRFTPSGELSEISAVNASSYTYEGEAEEIKSAVVIEVDGSSIPCHTARYRVENPVISPATVKRKITIDDIHMGKHTLDELISQLTVEEMANICVGAARGGWGANSTIGMASALCPGAAGDTTSLLHKDRNIANMILADGPAGLRLSTKFAADARGNLIPNTASAPISGLDFLSSGDEKPEMPKDAVGYYQYCTAIPIATLLAQTWDKNLIEEAGDIIGEEMTELGVTLWLAPGMNIHRNPLCGRNFEYFSEDPLISGVCAAAMTNGVQKYPGIGTTIKHLALNNQEDNRGNTSANASERAIREIYLKGFEYAVKWAQPMAIMTSYNLLNGIHTANHYDLLTAVVRDEWGFKGLIMTDWGTTGNSGENEHKYSCSNAAGCIKAGNDLIMPGSQSDVEKIIRSVGASPTDVACPITLGDLQACAKRILNVLLNSSVYDNYKKPYQASCHGSKINY